jgi:hypothetical protein
LLMRVKGVPRAQSSSDRMFVARDRNDVIHCIF